MDLTGDLESMIGVYDDLDAIRTSEELLNVTNLPGMLVHATTLVGGLFLPGGSIVLI